MSLCGWTIAECITDLNEYGFEMCVCSSVWFVNAFGGFSERKMWVNLIESLSKRVYERIVLIFTDEYGLLISVKGLY